MANIMTRAVILLSVFTGIMIFFGCAGTRPSHVAKGHGMLAPCPETPNCVSTAAGDETHSIEPLTYDSDTRTAMDKLVKVIQLMKRTKIVTQTDNYLYAEFTSAFWRFVDDVEFSFDEEKKIIHFRSASRLGKSDLGVNRDRMEEIRKSFNAVSR